MEEKEAPSSNKMRAFAYRLLGRREYSAHELGQRIHRKWPEAEGVEELLLALREENLQSDDRYVESFVRFRCQRFQGPLKIRAALSGKGVDSSLVTRELDAHAHEWNDLAFQWLDRQNAGDLDFDGKKTFYRRLTSRGFTHDQAMDAIGRKMRPGGS